MASYYSVSYCFAADLVITDWSSEGKCQFFSFTHSLLCNRAEQGPQPCWAVCVVLADFMRSWWKSMQENWEKVVAVLVWACFSTSTQGCRDCLSGEWGWIPHVAQCFRLDDKSFLPNHTCGVTAPLSVSWPWLHLYNPSITSTSLPTCISSGTSSASSRAEVPLSARAPVQGKSSERGGGNDDAQGSKRKAEQQARQGTTARCC